MKKIFALLLSLVLVGAMAATMAVSAADPDEGHYLWTFDDDTLNDTKNGVFSADSGNNKLTLKNVPGATLSPAAVQAGMTVGAYIDGAVRWSGDAPGSDNALYAAGVYFEMEKAINLKSDAAWYISITGRLPNGANGTNTQNGNPDSVMFAGEGQEFFIVGNGLPLMFTKETVDASTADTVETEYRVRDTEKWTSDYRMGQGRTQKLEVWNEYNETAKQWELHWVVNRVGATDAWCGIECASTAISGVDFTFNTIGSLTNFLGANNWGVNDPTKVGAAFFTEIEIYEDLSTFENTPIAAIPADLITAPKAGVAFSKTLNLGADLEGIVSATVTWTNEEGTVKVKASAGNTYIATVTLTPVMGYAFTADTTVPEGMEATLNEDGSLTLKATYKLEGEAADAPAGNETTAATTTAAPAANTTAAATTAAAEKSGCGSSLGMGAIAISAAAAMVALKKKKEQE